MVKRKFICLALVLLAAVGVAVASANTVLASEQEESPSAVCCVVPQPFDLGKQWGL